MKKGNKAYGVTGNDKGEGVGENATHTHGLKFTNAGAEGDAMVSAKFNSLPSCDSGGKKTKMNYKGA
jgi:hypothetical protein